MVVVVETPASRCLKAWQLTAYTNPWTGNIRAESLLRPLMANTWVGRGRSVGRPSRSVSSGGGRTLTNEGIAVAEERYKTIERLDATRREGPREDSLERTKGGGSAASEGGR